MMDELVDILENLIADYEPLSGFGHYYDGRIDAYREIQEIIERMKDK